MLSGKSTKVNIVDLKTEDGETYKTSVHEALSAWKAHTIDNTHLLLFVSQTNANFILQLVSS